MSEQRRFNERTKNAMDNVKLRLSTKCPTPSGKGKFANLTWQVVNGNPRIVVYTGDPEDKHDYGRITAKTDIIIFSMIIEAIRKMSQAPKGEKLIINCQDYTWFGGKKSEQPEITAQIYVGKDQEGFTYLSVIDPVRKERPKVKFQFKPPSFSEILDKNGNPLEAEELSRLVANAYADALAFHANYLSIQTWVEPKPANKSGGGFNNNNRGGNQSSESSDIDFDNIDF